MINSLVKIKSSFQLKCNLLNCCKMNIKLNYVIGKITRPEHKLALREGIECGNLYVNYQTYKFPKSTAKYV